jgi:putative sigma-54 modulation protein
MLENIEITVKNMELTDRIRTYVLKKFEKISRLLGDIDNAHVVLSYAKSAREPADRQVTEITLHGKGFILRTEERADDTLTSIDNAMDKLSRQIERFKGKRQHIRTGAARTEEAAEEQMPIEEETLPTIMRRKQFILEPMDEQEAIEQMRLLAHENFFLFYNITTDSINVLYVRRDGTLGLIEPKMA